MKIDIKTQKSMRCHETKKLSRSRKAKAGLYKILIADIH